LTRKKSPVDSVKRNPKCNYLDKRFILLDISSITVDIEVFEKAKKKTVKRLLTFTRELDEKLDKVAKATIGDRQGYLSVYVEMILRNHLQMTQALVEES